MWGDTDPLGLPFSSTLQFNHDSVKTDAIVKQSFCVWLA